MNKPPRGYIELAKLEQKKKDIIEFREILEEFIRKQGRSNIVHITEIQELVNTCNEMLDDINEKLS